MDPRAVRGHPSGSRPDPLTTARIFVRDLARRDIAKQADWLRREVDTELGDRFAHAVNGTFVQLAAEPGLGPPAEARSPRLTGTRRWRVTGFSNHLIFYRQRNDGVSVVRVLHAASDWKQR